MKNASRKVFELIDELEATKTQHKEYVDESIINEKQAN